MSDDARPLIDNPYRASHTPIIAGDVNVTDLMARAWDRGFAAGDERLRSDFQSAASPDERLREAGELERFLSTMAFVLPNLNDTFAFACADTEKISVGDGKLLADFWRRHGWRGLVAIAAVKRKAQPLAEVAATPEFQAAYAELLAGEQHPDEDGEPWTLADEFEIDGQADALAAADREAPDEETP